MSVKLISDNKVYSLDEIMAAPDMEPVFVPVPEWGDGGVLIRPMTVDESNTTLEAGQAAGGKLNVSRYSQELLAASLINPTLTDEQAADLLARKSARAIRRIVEAVQDLNVTSKEAKAALVADFPAEPTPAV